MPWYFIVIELVVYCLAVVLLRHAYAQGLRWLATTFWAMAFGLAVELLLVRYQNVNSQHYVYGDFLIDIGTPGHLVPLWVGVGWGLIVYISTFTAQRLRAPWVLRPCIAGVLAVGVDLSLDPMAERLGFWKWHNVDPINYYGVPFDNFLGWFWIVASFSLFVRIGFNLVRDGRWGSTFWIPPIGAAFAVLAVLLVGRLVDFVYLWPLGQVGLFVVVFAAAAGITWGFALRTKRDNPKNWEILSLPLVINALLILMLLFTKEFINSPTLLVAIPINMLASFFAFSWPSLETLFQPAAENQLLGSRQVR